MKRLICLGLCLVLTVCLWTAPALAATPEHKVSIPDTDPVGDSAELVTTRHGSSSGAFTLQIPEILKLSVPTGDVIDSDEIRLVNADETVVVEAYRIPMDTAEMQFLTKVLDKKAFLENMYELLVTDDFLDSVRTEVTPLEQVRHPLTSEAYHATLTTMNRNTAIRAEVDLVWTRSSLYMVLTGTVGNVLPSHQEALKTIAASLEESSK